MSTIINKSDFDKICRVCLQFRRDMVKIGLEIFNVLKALTTIDIIKYENLPRNICKICLNKVNDILLFKKQIQAASELLTQVANKIPSDENLLNEVKSNDENDSSPVVELNISSDENFCNETAESSEITNNINKKRIQRAKLLDPNKCDRNTYTCKVCNSVLVNIYSLGRHMERHNENRKCNFTCEVCNRKFYEKGHLTKHMRRHKGETRYKCEKCNKSFYELSVLAVHMRKHDTEPLQCNFCQKEFMIQLQLDIHMKVHNKTHFTCNHCKKKFHHASHLKRHQVIHIEEYRFKCEDCEKTFKSEYYLNMHKKRLHSVERNLIMCNICGKAVSRLKDHIANVHQEKMFKCTECSRLFSKKYYLLHHKKRDHINIQDESIKRPYLCSTCGKRFISNSALRDHYLHIHTVDKLFACQICSKKFKTDKNCNTHMRLCHSGDKRYQCTVCSKSFHLNTTLKVHMRTHTGERPFECKLCTKSFAQSSTLKTHMKVHGLENIKNCTNNLSVKN